MAATRDALTERLQSIRETTSLLYNRIVDNRYGRQIFKGIIEKEVREEQEERQTKRKADLTPQGHQRALKGAYKGFVIPGLPKEEIDDYLYRVKPHVKTLTEVQDHNLSIKMEETCEFSYYVRPCRCRGSSRVLVTSGKWIRQVHFWLVSQKNKKNPFQKNLF